VDGVAQAETARQDGGGLEGKGRKKRTEGERDEKVPGRGV